MNRTAGILTTSSERNSENTLCRLCMKNNDYFYNIFTSNVACRMTVKDAINGLLGLEVAVGDGLPTTMCPLCLKKLTEFRVFKMTCLESDAKLRNFSGINCFRSIQGEEAADDKLGTPADTKDFIQDEIQGTSHLTCSALRTEIYIPVQDSQQLGTNMLSIQGDEAADDELGSSADTKDFIQDEIQGTSHLTHSVQRTEIYIPMPDSHQFKDNMLETVKEENEDPLSEGNYHVVYTPDPAKTSSNALDPLAINDLSDIGTCGSSSVKADQFSDDGGGYAHNNSTNGATNDLVSQASDQPTVTENEELIQNYLMAMESMTEDVESPAPERASALFSVLEPKIRASHSRKRKDVMDKDTNKCDNLLADQITCCSIPNDGRLHSKSRYVYKIGGNRATTTNAEKRGGCDNADTTKFSRSTDNGKNDPEAIIRENKVKSTCMIKNPGNCASSTKNSYHCFICRDAFNAKHDLINHLKIHFGSGKLDIDSNLSIGKDFSLKSVFSSRYNNGFCLPFSKSLNQLMCKSQEVGQKGNWLLNDNFGGTREDKNAKEVKKSLIVDGKPCTVIPTTAKKSYFCSECEKPFSEKSHLVSHIRTHTKEKPFSRKECDKSYSRKSTLVTHIRTHTKEKPYSCCECEKSFHKKSDLVRHMRTHTKEKPYSCCECEKSFSDKSNLVRHIRTHTKSKPYSCSECEKSFHKKNDLVRHMRTHTKEKPHSCCECEKSFSEKSHLVSHIRTHTKEKPFSCKECDKSFSRKSTLVTHIRTHTKEKPFSCNECDKSFSGKGNLVIHIRTHTKEKPYSCSQCEKSFSHSSNLVCHIRTHTKEKPYSCNECDKSFSQKINLVCHARTHTKGKHYSCNQCDKSFSDESNLVSHIRSHTNEKPYTCNECDVFL